MDERRYAVHIDSVTQRVQYITFEEYAASEDTIVDAIPEGRHIDYLFIDGQFIFSPLPPEYPVSEMDVAAETVFMVGDVVYRATTAIAKGERITPYNSETLTQADIFNAFMALQQRGE